jgi:hypothetical protein
VGTIKSCGWKFGRWLDIVLMEKPLGRSRSHRAGRAMKSKTLAAWLAFLGGPIGLHRFYLYGLGDRWGWLLPLPTRWAPMACCAW